MVQTLKETEAKHPIGNCAFCLRKRVFLVALPCAHSYCAKCCLSLVKVTRIKKGLFVFNENDTQNSSEQQPLKCPKCNIVHLVTEADLLKYEEVMGVDEIKERVKKRNEVKLLSLYKTAESTSPEVQLKQNVQLCHLCPPNMTNP